MTDKKKLTLGATAGSVILAGEGMSPVYMTPALARDIAKHLPRFAQLAETTLEPEPETADLGDLNGMVAYIEGLGFEWKQGNCGRGFWVAPTTKEVYTPLGDKETVTRNLFDQLARVVRAGSD